MAYSCLYLSLGYELSFSYPVTAGQDYRLQVVFFEVCFSNHDGRKVNLGVEGEQLVTDLDTHTWSPPM